MKVSQNARALIIALACGILSGCATESVRVTPEHPERAPIRELQLGGIELESLYSYTESLAEIESVIVSSASRAGIAVAPRGIGVAQRGNQKEPDTGISRDDSIGRATISFFIRERSYTKGFRSTLSLAIIADIRDGSGNTILRAEYFHDGDESFDSIGFLTKSLDATFKEIARAMRNAI
ncbi:MAG TPA: hypothetical protein PK542_00920 [Treponemataceae bacterium]|nr:hypothetical protein [Treponemataceae bacterium]HPS43027.1 hypothetical protein [Treponemataceae bacterium]